MSMNFDTGLEGETMLIQEEDRRLIGEVRGPTKAAARRGTQGADHQRLVSTSSPTNGASTKRPSPEDAGDSEFEPLDNEEKQLLNIIPQNQRLMSNGLLEINTDTPEKKPGADDQLQQGTKVKNYKVLSINIFKDENLRRSGKSSMLSGGPGVIQNNPTYSQSRSESRRGTPTVPTIAR
jgi:hypothetical protein